MGLEAPGSATLAILGGLTLDANGGLGFSSTMPSEVFSQSFQLLSNDDADIKWIGGVDYSKEDGKVFQTGDTFGQSAYSSKNDLDIETEAAFAQVTIPFGLAWSTTLGRPLFTRDTMIFARRSLRLPLARRTAASSHTPRVSSARATAGWRTGAVSSGFKSATLNPGAPTQGEADPEEVDVRRNRAEKRLRLERSAQYLYLLRDIRGHTTTSHRADHGWQFPDQRSGRRVVGLDHPGRRAYHRQFHTVSGRHAVGCGIRRG